MKPPGGLKTAGRALWKAIADDLDEGLELAPREAETLRLACAQADLAKEFEAALPASGVVTAGSRGQDRVHPAVGAVQSARALEARLLRELDLADGDAAVQTGPSQASGRAAAAARERWARRRGSTAA
jgi:phage terminase small subunit